jgi:presenilin-like A22 family membrane protease
MAKPITIILYSIPLFILSFFALFMTGIEKLYLPAIILGILFGLIVYKKEDKKTILLYSSIIVFIGLITSYFVLMIIQTENANSRALTEGIGLITILFEMPKWYELLLYPLLLNIFQFISPKKTL